MNQQTHQQNQRSLSWSVTFAVEQLHLVNSSDIYLKNQTYIEN